MLHFGLFDFGLFCKSRVSKHFLQILSHRFDAQFDVHRSWWISVEDQDLAFALDLLPLLIWTTVAKLKPKPLAR